MKSLSLRPYQLESIEGLRSLYAQRLLHLLLASPTGSGKSVMATHLTLLASEKFTRTMFVVDRVALVDQISAMFSEYGIEHGIVQASHRRYKPWEHVQVVSAPTLARRDMSKYGQFDLLIWDECHIHNKAVSDYIAKNPRMKVLGLSATPFTRGLGKTFSHIVNVTTTNKLIDEEWLAPLKVYAARPIDMTGAEVDFKGEWKPTEVEKRSLTIVGDIVSGWIDKTNRHFGGPVKTIGFSATVSHGEDMCRQFQRMGYNFQQVSYRDGNDERRRKLIEGHRNGDILGLISCEALGRGYDVPDIQCLIDARPFRKSLSAVIQKLGRAMRPYPGKDYALVLDHSLNYLRFKDDIERFFEHGIDRLDDQSLSDDVVRKEPDEDRVAANACKACGFVLLPTDEHCPSCGARRWRRQVQTEILPGELVEVPGRHIAAKPERLAWMADKEGVQRMIWAYALERKGGDVEAAQRFALAQYRNMYEEWPKREFAKIDPQPYTPAVAGKIRRQLLKYWERVKQTEAA